MFYVDDKSNEKNALDNLTGSAEFTHYKASVMANTEWAVRIAMIRLNSKGET